jgi:uncharacterized protein (DUF488 family)
VLSLGYERRTINELISILINHRVKKLLDVRESAHSRRKDFNKNALALSLEAAGIKYKHLRSAGNPHRQEKNDIKRCLRLYKAYLKRRPEVLAIVADEVMERGTAVLCYERQHNNCHRSVLLEAVCRNGHSFEIVEVE